MRLYNDRHPRGHDEGPQSAAMAEGLGGVSAGFIQSGALAQGRCPICHVKMNRGNQRSCVKSTATGYGQQGERLRGRGAFVFGRAA